MWLFYSIQRNNVFKPLNYWFKGIACQHFQHTHELVVHFSKETPVKLDACSCLTLQPIDCGPLGSSVRGILQARILEWAAIPFSRGSALRDQTQVSYIAVRFFTIWTTREAPLSKETPRITHTPRSPIFGIALFSVSLIWWTWRRLLSDHF